MIKRNKNRNKKVIEQLRKIIKTDDSGKKKEWKKGRKCWEEKAIV